MSEQAYAYPAVPRRRVVGIDPRGPAAALAVAALCVFALALTWLLAEHVYAVEVKDWVLLRDFTMLRHPPIGPIGSFLLHLVDPLEFIIWGVALVSYALGRGRPRIALAVVAVMGLAPFTSETLKPLLAHQHPQFGRPHIGPASWPSGHTTAAVALALCAVLVAPTRLRPLVAALGALFAAAVAGALLILDWHMPSDILGGVLVATLWMALALAALRAAELRWPTHPPGQVARPRR
jgi:membrane-associated phospholipid phosphatase